MGHLPLVNQDPVGYKTMASKEMLDFIKSAKEAKEFTGGSFAKITSPGVYPAEIIEAAFEKNREGTKHQGKVKIEVNDGPVKGARMTSYIALSADGSAKSAIPYVKLLASLGYTDNQIVGNAEKPVGVVKNIVSILQDMLLNDNHPKVALVITRRNDDKTKYNANIALFEGATFKIEDESDSEAGPSAADVIESLPTPQHAKVAEKPVDVDPFADCN